MYDTQCLKLFGICQIGEWDTFNHNRIESPRKRILELSMPFPMCLSVLKRVHHVFLVSLFSEQTDIIKALDFIKLCRNNSNFIIVVTSVSNNARNDLVELRNNVDVFLLLEDKYYENNIIIDPVSYAIDFLASSFDEEEEVDDEFFCDSLFYAFSQSGSARMIVFQLSEADYTKKNNLQLPSDVVRQVTGKCLAFVRIKTGSNIIQVDGLIKKAFKEASGKMLYIECCFFGGIKNNNQMRITAIVSDMDNPNNSFSGGKTKRFSKKENNME